MKTTQLSGFFVTIIFYSLLICIKNNMKNLLKLEQLGILMSMVFMYYKLDYAWFWCAILFFAPDILMIGYLFGNKIGAISYNLVHNYILTFSLIIIGYLINNQTLIMIGLIFTAHTSFDRFLGFGLKTFEGFKFTHLN